MKDVDAVRRGIAFERITRFADEMGNVDYRQGVRAFDDKQGTWRQAAQDLAGAQGRQRTFQAPKVERNYRGNFGHRADRAACGAARIVDSGGDFQRRKDG